MLQFAIKIIVNKIVRVLFISTDRIKSVIIKVKGIPLHYPALYIISGICYIIHTSEEGVWCISDY